MCAHIELMKRLGMKQQEDARMRLLHAGMAVFAEVGFHAATTREISRRAEVNLAAIHYYFADKAGLYRAVFALPFAEQGNVFAQVDIESATLEEALSCFYQWILPPTARAEEVMLQKFMQLHAREEADPSGILGDALSEHIKPNHEKLKQLLCRELGKLEPDLAIEQLAFAIMGMASAFVHGRRVVEVLAPELIHGKNASDVRLQRLIGYAKTLIDAERGQHE